MAESLGISPRALRHYEQLGLISAHRDQWRCRRYDLATQRRAMIIAELRRAGLGLNAIKDVLQTGDQAARTDTALVHLEARLADLRCEMEAVQSALNRFAAEKAGPAG